MGISIFMVDIFTITLMDATFAHHKSASFISRCAALLYFLSAIIILIFFFVISLIRHQLSKFLQF